MLAYNLVAPFIRSLTTLLVKAHMARMNSPHGYVMNQDKMLELMHVYRFFGFRKIRHKNKVGGLQIAQE